MLRVAEEQVISLFTPSGSGSAHWLDTPTRQDLPSPTQTASFCPAQTRFFNPPQEGGRACIFIADACVVMLPR